MQNRLSYNINTQAAGADRQATCNAQIALHSPYVLLMDDHKSEWFFSKQLAARSPETVRICRTYMNGRDGDLNEAQDGNSPTGRLSAVNYINFLENLHAPAGTVHQVFCEPDYHSDRLKAKVTWLCDVIKEASRRGIRLCVDNVQTVTLDQRELDAGYYDALYFTLAQHPEHLYGIHEYWLGDAWFNTNKQRMSFLTLNAPVPFNGFITETDSSLKESYIDFPTEAHLGRCEVIAQRCRKIGAPVPRMVYTEIGVDDVRLSQHDDVKAINGGREPMGYPTMGTYWQTRYPRWSRAQTFVEMCKWLNRSMPAYVVGACLFGMDTSFENGAYHLGDTELQTRLQDYVDSLDDVPTTPTPPPTAPALSDRERIAALEARVGKLEAKLGL